MNVCAVVVVGEPVRGGVGILTLLGGVPVVARSVQALLDVVGIEHVRLLVPAGQVACVAEACRGMPVTLHGSAADLWAHADGDGQTTDRSVVLVHDGARPLAPASLVGSVLDAVRAGHPVVVPVLPLTDTVKQIDGTTLGATPDRTGLRVVQTPQGFRGDLRPGVWPNPTRAWSTVDGPAHAVPGHPLAFAVQHPWDLELAGSTIGAGG